MGKSRIRSLKIVFFGTPEFVLPVLKEIHKNFTDPGSSSCIKAVVTQPPRVSGRKRRLDYSPVDTWAHRRNVPVVHKPQLNEIPKADLGILAAYGQIVPASVIKLFPLGILNIHPSLLPELRGASPVQAAIAFGAKFTGVSIIKMDEKLDHGPIVSQFEYEIGPEDTSRIVYEKLFKQASHVLVELIPAYARGKIQPKKQDHDKATYTHVLKRDDGHIPSIYLAAALKGRQLDQEWKIGFVDNLTLKPNPQNIERFIRAMQDWPGAWTNLDENLTNKKIKNNRLKILHAEISGGKLKILKVQLEGKNPVTWKELAYAYQVELHS